METERSKRDEIQKMDLADATTMSAWWLKTTKFFMARVNDKGVQIPYRQELVCQLHNIFTRAELVNLYEEQGVVTLVFAPGDEGVKSDIYEVKSIICAFLVRFRFPGRTVVIRTVDEN